MSIWATILAFDEPETYAYQGSHVMPAENHRGGTVLDLAAIPADVCDDEADPDAFLPWLRVSLGREDAVIDRVQVEALWDTLGLWLDRQIPETRKDEG